MKKKSLAAICIVVIAAFVTTLFITKEQKEKTSTLLEGLYSYQGYTRVISEEEMEFYRYFVERDLPNDTDENEITEKVKEYANEVNAIFYLGNKLGFCEPYSFEALKLRMEQENTERKISLEQGEVVYGLEEFSLEIYFQYVMDNVESDLQSFLEENADEGIYSRAETYYQEHEEEFIYRKEVTYEQTLDGVTQTLTADVDTLSLLGKTDTAMADFLQMAESGEIYEDTTEEGERRILLKEIIYSDKGYENNVEMALYRVVRDELYNEVIHTVAMNNPVSFE